MEDITVMMELDDLVSVESDDLSTSIQSKTLLDLPEEAIEMILSNLNPEDKKNFGLTSKKNNEILSNSADLWKDVWLRVPGEKTPKASELTRKYVNLDCDLNSFMQLANDGIFTHLATNLKVLAVRPSYSNFHLSLKCLTSTLPFFVNLVHLDFSAINSFSLHDDIDDSTAIDQKLQSVPVDMKKLKHLRMSLFVFLKLNGRFVNFSTSSLKTLDLYSNEHDESDEKVIASLIERQKNLEILKLDLNNGAIFDKPLKLEVLLKEIELVFRENLNAQQQNNMCYFLDSQKGLQRQIIEWNGRKTDRMLNYLMRLLDSTVNKQTIRIRNYHGMQRNYWNIVSKNPRFTLDSTEFLSYPHQENSNTVTLDLDIEFTTVPEVESVITRIFEKFPNLMDLGIELSGGNLEALSSINWSNLEILKKLESLESLELIGFTLGSSLNRLLDNLTIPSLKKFVSHPNFLALRDCSHVKKFMTRHVNLNCMEFRLRRDHQNTLPAAVAEAQAEVTEIFANSGFNVKMIMIYSMTHELVIALTKGENEN